MSVELDAARKALPQAPEVAAAWAAIATAQAIERLLTILLSVTDGHQSGKSVRTYRDARR